MGKSVTSSPENVHLQYQYTGGVLSTFIDATGQPWSYAYTNGRITIITMPKGHPSLRMAYDALGGSTIFDDIAGELSSNGGQIPINMA